MARRSSAYKQIADAYRARQRIRERALILVPVLIAMIARCVLLAGVTLMAWAAIPAAWGWIPTTVSSNSMAPSIRAGDVVIAMPIDVTSVRAGQVLLVQDPAHPGDLRLHRFVDRDGTGALVLRGDANSSNDSDGISPAAVRGVGVLRVPIVGLPGLWLREGATVPLAGTAAGALLLLMLSGIDRPSSHYLGLSRGARLRRTISAGAALSLVVTSVALGPTGSRAAFSAVSAGPTSEFGSQTSYACLSPAPVDDPLLVYRFNELSGTSVADDSGHDLAAVIQGDATWLAGSCATDDSPALRLDGTGSYVSTVAPQPGPSQFTIELWFATTTVAGGKLLGFGDAATGTSSLYDRHLYMTDAGRLVFGVYPGSVKTITSASNYNDGEWHQAIATLSPSGMMLYIDGALAASSASVTSAAPFTGYWRLGFDNLNGWTSQPASPYFAGTIDSVAIYSSALTPAQVAEHFAAGR